MKSIVYLDGDDAEVMLCRAELLKNHAVKMIVYFDGDGRDAPPSFVKTFGKSRLDASGKPCRTQRVTDVSGLRQAVEECGGKKAFDRLIGNPPGTVKKWLKRGYVSPGQCLRIFEATDGKYGLSFFRPDLSWFEEGIASACCAKPANIASPRDAALGAALRAARRMNLS